MKKVLLVLCIGTAISACTSTGYKTADKALSESKYADVTFFAAPSNPRSGESSDSRMQVMAVKLSAGEVNPFTGKIVETQLLYHRQRLSDGTTAYVFDQDKSLNYVTNNGGIVVPLLNAATRIGSVVIATEGYKDATKTSAQAERHSANMNVEAAGAYRPDQTSINLENGVGNISNRQDQEIGDVSVSNQQNQEQIARGGAGGQGGAGGDSRSNSAPRISTSSSANPVAIATPRVNTSATGGSARSNVSNSPTVNASAQTGNVRNETEVSQVTRTHSSASADCNNGSGRTCTNDTHIQGGKQRVKH